MAVRRRHSASHDEVFDDNGEATSSVPSPSVSWPAPQQQHHGILRSPNSSTTRRPSAWAFAGLNEGSTQHGESQSEEQPQRSRSHDNIRVRFSSDNLAQTGDTLHENRPGQSISQRPNAPSLSIDTSGNQVLPAYGASSLHSPESPIDDNAVPGASSVSARTTRNRGYSLRRTLFNKNVEHRIESPHTSIYELSQPGSSLDRPSPPERVTEPRFKNSPITVVTPLAEESREDQKGDFLSLTTLPNYENWLRAKASKHRLTRRIRDTLHQVRRFVFRVAVIPPTKDGRHIDLDAGRKAPLIDERTNKLYIPNTIRSSRYNAWNFVPRQLWAQFSKLANAYFLFVSILQLIPGLSTTGTYTTIVPLMFFVAISIAKEGYDDWRRYKLDKEENNRDTQVFRAYRPIDGETNESLGPRVWASTKWKDVQVGDIVRVSRNDQFPSDLILLNSKGEKQTAYIETMALDGETNLKCKQPVACLARTCDTLEKLATCNAHLVVEDPNLDLYNFEGRVTADGETMPLSNNEIVYRGSVLRNTPEIIGIAIYSGEECKIRMNANKNPRIKAPSLQAMVNKIIICMVIFVLVLSICNAAAYEIWQERVEEESWYLESASVAFMPVFVSFIIMFNTLIPLSLYVSLEIVKVCQRWLLNDIDMYDEDTDTPMEARTSTINEELGQVSYIFSDKTGTLTDNCMKFRKFSVAGIAWLHDPDLKLEALENASRQRHRHAKNKGKQPARGRPLVSDTVKSRQSTSSALMLKSAHDSNDDVVSTGWKSSARPAKSQSEMQTVEMLRYIQRKPFTVFARKARFFLLSMAVCHTCLPEVNDNGDIDYQASSPDELALVQAAQEMGYMLVERESGVLTIKSFPRGIDAEPQLDRYEILDVIEFSSKRKRMSVIVRFPDKRICVMCKGADSVIVKLLRLSDIAHQKTADIERRSSIRKSMEAQQAIARRSEHSERASPSSPFSGRQSIGGLGRSSVSGPAHLYRGQFDQWLRDREHDVDASVNDEVYYSPRPSDQFGRNSIASYRESIQNDEAFELVDEALVVDEPATIERCLQHVDDFATEGLRTLLYGYRFLDQNEYDSWHKLYKEAATSLVNRQAELERAGDLIEHSLEMAGATAIEDKLQKGVPETIDKLRRAGIKMWMLTGDKRETAINIGQSCRLIKDYSTVTILDQENGHLEQTIASAIVSITKPPPGASPIAHSVVVIDGGTLAQVDASHAMNALFIDLASVVDSVICCRASPSQKASLVKAVRRKVRSSITLAIGDGANDIAMIQEAHVGIGITGKEGLQAARTSDYSIAQFRFLCKLLLVHGRWNYLRTAKYTAATFWKEMMFYLTQALYQRYTGYTGTSLYESWSLTTFNTLFTSLPVIILGVFEKDLLPQTLLAVPELYSSMGLKNAGFNFKVFAWWVFLASAEAIMIFFFMIALYGTDDGNGMLGSLIKNLSKAASTLTNSPALATINANSGGSDTIFPLGSLTFTAVVIIVSGKLQFLEMHDVSIANIISAVVSIGGWFLWNILLSIVYADNVIYKVKNGFLQGFGQELSWWATLLLVLVSVGTLELGWRVLRWVIGDHSWQWKSVKLHIPGPTDAEIFQSLEKDAVLLHRFEQAAQAQMPYSLAARKAIGGYGGTDDGVSAAAAERTAVEVAKREQEVSDLLARRAADESANIDVNAYTQFTDVDTSATAAAPTGHVAIANNRSKSLPV